MSVQSVVLITGASSGVGQSTARLLSQKGYRVFGTSRNPSRSELGVEMVPLDVRNDDSVTTCVRSVLEKTGRIDVLINNAGYELSGALEETSLEEARSQFDTNFFGAVRMINAALPSMRERRQGRIINVGSFSGVSAIPFMGMYSASKSALEGYSDALRMELAPFNIHVSITEPGFLKTPMMDKRLPAAAPISAYDVWRQRAFNAFRAFEETAPGGESVADALLEIVSSRSPRLRYLIGPQAKSTSRLMRLLPTGMFEQGKRRAFKLDKPSGER
jgi:NAD(P)-dependent dehydrogenase (short-subunit alcohol dehydrogenase family)